MLNTKSKVAFLEKECAERMTYGQNVFTNQNKSDLTAKCNVWFIDKHLQSSLQVTLN